MPAAYIEDGAVCGSSLERGSIEADLRVGGKHQRREWRASVHERSW
jgi:hypothetical protein